MPTQEITIQHIDNLINAFCNSYKRYNDNEFQQNAYCESFSYTVGTKYIRLLRNKSAIAFIVNVHNHDLPYGAILAPKSYNTPNIERGMRTSIFAIDKISWLGVQ